MDLIPHAICLASEPWIVAALAIGDAAIFVAYMLIPISIGRAYPLVKNDKALRRLAGLFIAFIAGCGLTHLLGAITMFYGNAAYAVEAIILLGTALVSLTTVAFMTIYLPAMLGGLSAGTTEQHGGN